MGTRPQTDLQQLYRKVVRRHAEQPQGFREPIETTHRYEEYNPLCGDRIEIQLRIVAEHIEAAAFDGEACAICMASASLLCDVTPGRPVPALQQLSEALRRALVLPAESAERPPEAADEHSPLDPALHPLLGVRPYPSRVRCATLPWTAAVRALDRGTG
jgi:nitrogen fixation NifU-like protein